MPSPLREHRPWPLKWVVIAILVCVIPYTYVRLHFSKPNKAFEPYADLKDQANTKRLLAAGFQRVALTAQRPSDPTRALMVASVAPAPGGVPDALRASLLDPPRLPADIVNVAAASNIESGQAYSIQFTCSLPDDRVQFGGAQLYVRGDELFLVPQVERLTDGLLTRSRENVIQVIVPANALKPGSYHATILAERGSKSWAVQVH